MKVKKKLLKSIKNKYIAERNSAEKESNKYKILLDKHNPEYGSKDYIFTKHIYYLTQVEMCEYIIKDLERMEGKI